MAAKFSNTRVNLLEEHYMTMKKLRSDRQILDVVDSLLDGIEKVYEAKSIEEIIGIEGNCAKRVF